MKSLYALVACLFCLATVQAQLDSRETPFLPGELLIQLGDNNDVDQVIQDLRVVEGRETGIHVKQLLSEYMRMWHIGFDELAMNAFDMKRLVYAHPKVNLVQFNHLVEQRETVPNDPDLDEQWHHVNSNDSDIDSDLAWDITTGGTTAFGDEIVVCVIEGGNLNHPDLVDNKWVNEQEIPGNGIDDDGNGYIDDYNGWNVSSNNDAGVFNGGHGTQVMGMIGAKGNNDLGVSGINWDVKIMSVAGENLGSEASVVAAYNYPLEMRMIYDETGGASGAFVVATNASWGIDGADAANYPIWCEVYDTLGQHGILSCGATANNNVNIDVVGDMPTGCPSPYMVAVTATNSNDVRTFSGYGVNTIDLGAPGADVYTTSGSNGYGNTSGTSFASPLTAGAIALIYSTPCPSFMALVHADPQAGADYVNQVLMEGVDPIDNLADEVISGGRLNVFNSIQLILNACSESDCLAPFAVSFSDDGNGSYDLNWGTTGSMISFNLRYRVVGEAEWTEVNGLTDPSYNLGELVWCTEYEAQVQAICDEGESDWSALVTTLTEGCCEYPDEGGYVLSDVTETGATISWAPVLAAGSYFVVVSSEDSEEVFEDIINTSFVISGLDPCTMYDVSVGVNCANEDLAAEYVTTFTTFGCGPCADLPFCASFGGTQDEWIERIQINTLDNQSGDNGGYGDYTMNTTMTTALDQNQTYELTLTPGFDGFAYSELFVVWMDYNANGTFESSEIIYSSSQGSDQAVSGTFTTPSGLDAGSVRMRVSMKYAGFFGGADLPTPCEEMEFGEVEDYCIEITDTVIQVDEQSQMDWKVYPNPARNVLNLSLPYGEHLIELLDLSGRMVMQENLRGQSTLDVSALPAGSYVLKLTSNGLPQGAKHLVVGQ